MGSSVKKGHYRMHKKVQHLSSLSSSKLKNGLYDAVQPKTVYITSDNKKLFIYLLWLMTQ